MSIKTSTLFTFAGAELKKPEKVVVDPSPVVDTLEIVGVSPATANSTKVEPSWQPSYFPNVVLNLMIPVAALGLCAVVPTGTLNASVEPDTSKS